jgi:hypothetical protein
MMVFSRRRWVECRLVVALGVASPWAHADGAVEACVAAAERVPALRDAHKLTLARTEALACARASCPAVVRKDCIEAVQEIKSAMPSIVVRARSQGIDRDDARLLVDGAVVATRLDGTPITLDPGSHLLRVEAPNVEAVEQRFVVAEGEHNRLLELSLRPLESTPDARPGPPETSAAIPIAAWFAGGVGVVGVAGFTYFGLRALADIHTLKQTCAPYCSDDQIAPAQAKRLAADVSLGVGLIGFGIATWLFVRSAGRQPAAGASALRVDVQPLAGGATLRVEGGL